MRVRARVRARVRVKVRGDLVLMYSPPFCVPFVCLHVGL
jgi:hypothetical protein